MAWGAVDRRRWISTAVAAGVSEDPAQVKAEQRRVKAWLRRAKVRCPDLRSQRLFVPDKSGELVESWQFHCIPICKIRRTVQTCSESDALFVYVTTRRGKDRKSTRRNSSHR